MKAKNFLLGLGLALFLSLRLAAPAKADNGRENASSSVNLLFRHRD